MQNSIINTSFTLPLHTIITLGFYLVATIYILFSAIMYYHWKEYGTDAGVTKITLVLYLVTTLPLILIMGIVTLII